MPTRIAFPAQFAELIHTDSIHVPGATVGEALRQLTESYPVLETLVWPRDGSKTDLNPVIVVFLNGHDVRGKTGLGTPLQDGDELLVISAVEGG